MTAFGLDELASAIGVEVSWFPGVTGLYVLRVESEDGTDSTRAYVTNARTEANARRWAEEHLVSMARERVGGLLAAEAEEQSAERARESAARAVIEAEAVLANLRAAEARAERGAAESSTVMTRAVAAASKEDLAIFNAVRGYLLTAKAED